MKILLHVCCGPCAIYPVKEFRAKGLEVTGFFFNHNIHPYQEYLRRLDAAREFARQAGFELVCRDEYRLEEFLAAVATDPASRCSYCYASRLEATAQAAAEWNYKAYSSSLLYSRYQNHEAIRALGEQFGARYGVEFVYDDFRRGWQEGITLSKEMGLYRQPYCGCIYSEKDRYHPRKKSAA